MMLSTPRRPVPILLMVRALGIGGCERDLTKIALGLDREQFEPHIACIYSEGLRFREIQAAGVPIVTLPTRSLISWSAVTGARVLRKYIRDNRIQIAHAYDSSMDLIAVPFCRMYGVPVVIKSNLWFRTLTAPSYGPLFKFTDRIVDAIVTNSDAVRQDLIRGYHVPAGKIFLCHNGVDTAVFRPRSSEARVAPVRDASLVVGCVCAIRQEKRTDLLMRAFERVQNLRPGMKLLIVGSGPLQETVAKLRTSLGLESRCHLEPSNEDVSGWMRSIDIFVQASDSESFPNALLEAMACGCCVVASRVGGIPELVADRHNGLLFKPGDLDDLIQKLTYAIHHDEMRRTFGSRAVETAGDRFPITAIVRRMQTFYDSLLKQKMDKLRLSKNGYV